MNRRELLTLASPIGLAVGFWFVDANAGVRDLYPFSAAYFEGQTGGAGLVLFPLTGKAMKVRLPPLPSDFALLAFSPDGRALYGRTLMPDSSKGLIKIEFKPVRASVVPGSTDFGIQRLTIAPQQDRIFLQGWHRSQGNAYGIFELNPNTGVSKSLILQPDAFSPGSAPSDRKGNPMALLNPTNGTIQTVGDGLTAGAWSPDGNWIAAFVRIGESQKIVLIDSSTMQRRRVLGSTESDSVVWSPDSKYVLLSHSQLLCGPSSYYGSLEILDIETGKRSPIKSSHCRVVSTAFGWMDNRIVN